MSELDPPSSPSSATSFSTEEYFLCTDSESQTDISEEELGAHLGLSKTKASLDSSSQTALLHSTGQLGVDCSGCPPIAPCNPGSFDRSAPDDTGTVQTRRATSHLIPPSFTMAMQTPRLRPTICPVSPPPIESLPPLMFPPSSLARGGNPIHLPHAPPTILPRTPSHIKPLSSSLIVSHSSDTIFEQASNERSLCAAPKLYQVYHFPRGRNVHPSTTICTRHRPPSIALTRRLPIICRRPSVSKEPVGLGVGSSTDLSILVSTPQTQTVAAPPNDINLRIVMTPATDISLFLRSPLPGCVGPSPGFVLSSIVIRSRRVRRPFVTWHTSEQTYRLSHSNALPSCALKHKKY